MQILGIRISTKKTRYALVHYETGKYTLLNRETESLLEHPASEDKPDEKVEWLYRELERIVRENEGIKKVCIKTNKFTQNDNKSKRMTAYLEGAALLFCRQNSLPVVVRSYTSLPTSRREVQEFAEIHVGRTQKYWDSNMADAVIAAWAGAQR